MSQEVGGCHTQRLPHPSHTIEAIRCQMEEDLDTSHHTDTDQTLLLEGPLGNSLQQQQLQSTMRFEPTSMNTSTDRRS